MTKKIFAVSVGSISVLALAASLVSSEDKHALAESVVKSENLKEQIEGELVEEVPRHKMNSLALPPDLYIPDNEDFLNKEVSWEDVQKTISLDEIEKAIVDSLAKVAMGEKAHLGSLLPSMSQHQIQVFKDEQVRYLDKVEEVAKEATESYEIYAVVNEFNQWVDRYKALITEELNKIPEVVETEVKEVVELKEPVVAMDTSHKVSYGLPVLGDEYLTYMPYTAITSKNTPHYRLQQLAETDEEGYRVYKGARMIALASSFGTTIGTLYDIEFEDGKKLRAILGDNKSDAHTDDKKQYRDATEVYDGSSGNILEIIFDPTNYAKMNDVNKKINTDYPAKIKSITSLGVVEGFGK